MTGADQSALSRRMLAAIVIGLTAVALVNGAVSNQGPFDDAFIFFRYVDNLLRGYGLTWNKGGEHVEGYTSFLYVVVLLLPRKLGADPLAAASAINAALFAGTAAASLSLLRTLAGGLTRASLLAPLLIASSAVLGAASRNGMESMLFVFLIVVSLDLHLRRSARPAAAFASGALFGLAALARPEGLLLYGLASAYSALENRREGRPMFAACDGVRLLGMLAIVAPHTLWRRAYYHEWLPNTFYAKMGSASLGHVKAGLWGLYEGLHRRLGTMLAASLPLYLLAPRSRRGGLLAALFVAWIAYTVRTGLNDWSYWYVVPIHVFSLLLAGFSLGEIVRRPGEGGAGGKRRPVAAMLLLLVTPGTIQGPGNEASLGLVLYALRILLALLVLALGAAELLGRRRDAAALVRRLASGAFAAMLAYHAAYCVALRGASVVSFRVAADKLKEIVDPSETLALDACGEIPYKTDLITYDTVGLNDVHIAHTPMPERRYGGFGHDKGDGAYILSKKPTYLIPIPFIKPRPDPGPGHLKTFAEIFEMPELHEDYEFVSLPVANGYLNFYKRRPGR